MSPGIKVTQRLVFPEYRCGVSAVLMRRWLRLDAPSCTRFATSVCGGHQATQLPPWALEKQDQGGSQGEGREWEAPASQGAKKYTEPWEDSGEIFLHPLFLG